MASIATDSCCRWTRRSRRSLSICRDGLTSSSKASFDRERVGQLPTELVPHFFRSLAETLGAAINIKVTGENSHHMIEACFKGVGRALRQAFRITDTELPSTQGSCVTQLAIIDSGGANIASLQFAIERLGVEADADHRPGAFARRATSSCRASVRRPTAWRGSSARVWWKRSVSLRQPMLGICVGMQLLFESRRKVMSPAWACCRAVCAALPIAPACRCRTWAGISSSSSAVRRCSMASTRRLCLLRAQLRGAGE